MFRLCQQSWRNLQSTDGTLAWTDGWLLLSCCMPKSSTWHQRWPNSLDNRGKKCSVSLVQLNLQACKNEEKTITIYSHWQYATLSLSSNVAIFSLGFTCLFRLPCRKMHRNTHSVLLFLLLLLLHSQTICSCIISIVAIGRKKTDNKISFNTWDYSPRKSSQQFLIIVRSVEHSSEDQLWYYVSE